MYGSKFPSFIDPASLAYQSHRASNDPQVQTEQIGAPVAGVYKRVQPENTRSSYTPPAYIQEEARRSIAAGEQELMRRISSPLRYKYEKTNHDAAADYLRSIIRSDWMADKHTLNDALKFLEKKDRFGDSTLTNSKREAQNSFLYGMSDTEKLEMLSICLDGGIHSTGKDFIKVVRSAFPDDLCNLDTMRYLHDAVQSHVNRGETVLGLDLQRQPVAAFNQISGYLPNDLARNAVRILLTEPCGYRAEIAENNRIELLFKAGPQVSTATVPMPDSQASQLQSGSLKRKTTDEPAYELGATALSKRARGSMPQPSASSSFSSNPSAHDQDPDHDRGPTVFTSRAPYRDSSGRNFADAPFQDADGSVWQSVPYPQHRNETTSTHAPWWMTTPAPTDTAAATTAPYQPHGGELAGGFGVQLNDPYGGASGWVQTFSTSHSNLGHPYTAGSNGDMHGYLWPPQYADAPSAASWFPGPHPQSLRRYEPPTSTYALDCPRNEPAITSQGNEVAEQLTRQVQISNPLDEAFKILLDVFAANP